LLISGEALHVCIGINLCMLVALLIRMINTNYSDLVNLVASRADLAVEGERARSAELAALTEQANAREIADRFDSALNNMSQGLCFFDGAQRLIVCNRRYVDMYDLPPDSVKPGISLREIVHLRFEAGSHPAMTEEEYLAWRDQLVVNAEQHDSVVELANGRVIRICHRPMPDRGWVATHEDITDLRRREASFRLLFEEKSASDVGGRRQYARASGRQRRDLPALRLLSRADAVDERGEFCVFRRTSGRSATNSASIRACRRRTIPAVTSRPMEE
jgi:PAS domain-containing protein